MRVIVVLLILILNLQAEIVEGYCAESKELRMLVNGVFLVHMDLRDDQKHFALMNTGKHSSYEKGEDQSTYVVRVAAGDQIKFYYNGYYSLRIKRLDEAYN